MGKGYALKLGVQRSSLKWILTTDIDLSVPLSQFLTWEKNKLKAWEDLIDKLLESPHYGEHWGQHWLDVARYGESNGDDGIGRNASFPHAWRYRDYVIDAFNRDTPYDRFLAEQIAGDLLPAKNDAERRPDQEIVDVHCRRHLRRASGEDEQVAPPHQKSRQVG